jgi:hypothetical protein
MKMLENILNNVGDTQDKAFYKKAKGAEKQYENYKGWKPGKNITL